MQLTPEQIKIINSTGNIRINAVAGSGKTTTMVEYAKARSKDSKILYIAFNKSVKLEARRKFAEKDLFNVQVETAHSLAYRHIVSSCNYEVKSQDYKINEITDLLNILGSKEKHTEYVIANHVKKYVSHFCNSDKRKVRDLNYLNSVSDPKAKTFVSTFYPYIVSKARILLNMMNKGEIPIIHDFYLKKFQLSDPTLPYDYILFDEGQDASPAMLEIFLKQKAVKVIVGDTHQQIYGWRSAVNSLEKVDFKTFNLSTSFRFSQNIADLATETLNFKKYDNQNAGIQIKGVGTCNYIKTKAILARTNLGLLKKAIDYCAENKKIKYIYFEGNINSYAYADEGASLYDVLNLYNKKHSRIKDKLIRSMGSIAELEDYIKKTEDIQLDLMVEIVEEYGNKIPGIIRELKKKHVQNNARDNAQVIFSTVHRSKGMEYDAVQLVEDFISADKLKRIDGNKNLHQYEIEKIYEEINLLYVAITRAKNVVHIPETLVPKDFPKSPNIRILKILPVEVLKENEPPIEVKITANKDFNIINEIKLKHQEAYKPWSSELDDELTTLFCEGLPTRDLALHFRRTKGAITSRIDKLELREKYG